MDLNEIEKKFYLYKEKNFFQRFFGHLGTVIKHKRYVRRACFKMGLVKQGLFHDMSKFSLTEFVPSVKYYSGKASPNAADRYFTGCSRAWLHHKGRNKHHYEYWIDYSSRLAEPKLCGMLPAPMPVKYIVEMLMDRIAACKVYNGDAYTTSSPIEYYSRGMEPAPLHEKTKAILEMLLLMLSVWGEEKTFDFVRKELLPKSCKFDKTKNLTKCLEFCEKVTKRLEADKKKK